MSRPELVKQVANALGNLGSAALGIGATVALLNSALFSGAGHLPPLRDQQHLLQISSACCDRAYTPHRSLHSLQATTTLLCLSSGWSCAI